MIQLSSIQGRGTLSIRSSRILGGANITFDDEPAAAKARVALTTALPSVWARDQSMEDTMDFGDHSHARSRDTWS